MQPNSYRNITATGAVKNGSGIAVGVIISSHTGGTLKLWDSLSGAGATLVNTMTFGVGERFVPLYNAAFNIGLFATVGGTADLTIMYT